MARMEDLWTHPTQRMLDQFMATHAYDSPDEIDSYRECFQRAIRACEAIWGEHAFKRFRYPRWLDRVVAEIYDVQMIACHISSDEVLAKARGKNALASEKMARLLDAPPFSDRHGPTSRGFEATHAIRVVQELLRELAAE
ncbi:hypothetical protein [Nonomuraea sp. NEAU-A123]|uniref:hypothetical protein n=1 Tax=Nonomuraea sp. NEAU-A123 TaxID=2839649 RepID=UPI00203255AC|nr:hypothetical protein [Nonomuraea sp. NEAU-A123]